MNPVPLAEMGFHVFPLLPGSKKPAFKDWPNTSRRVEPEAEPDWADWNVGIFTGRYGDDKALLVVDVDNKGDKRGNETILQLELEGHVLPDTLTTLTPTGGRHLFYLVDSPVRQGANVLGPGVDIRSAGGYVVAPGSRLADVRTGDGTGVGIYQWAERETPIARAPQWLIDKCGQPRERATAPVKELTGYAAEVAYAKARHYLQDEAPIAAQGDGGDATTYAVACRVRDFGVSQREALDLMLDWNECCAPPWSPDELAAKVGNAYRYATGEFGGANPATVFEPVATHERAGEFGDAPVRYRLESFTDILARPPPKWLIRGILPERGMAVIYGAPGSGKTFLVLDIGAAIARGLRWGDRRTRRGRVVYVGLEGHVGTRAKAYVQSRELKPGDMDLFSVIERQPLDMLGAKDTIELARDIRAASDDPVALVVIDTLNRSLPGGDENSSEDMGKAIFAAGELSRRLDCLVCFVHHCGKSEGAGARGHSSLLGATDAELYVYRTEDGARFVETSKVKDGDDDVRFSFELRNVDLGSAREYDPEADDDERISSCVVESLRALPKEPGQKVAKLGVHAGNALAAFREVLALHALEKDRPFDDESIVFEHWKDAFLRQYVDDPSRSKRFYDARAELFRKGLVINAATGRVALTEAGKAL